MQLTARTMEIQARVKNTHPPVELNDSSETNSSIFASAVHDKGELQMSAESVAFTYLE